jgi:PKD repeat protein
MRWYCGSAATLALLALVGCGGDGNGPSNANPVAKFSIQCDRLDCAFTDASTDDGSIASRAWTFENGTPATSTATNPTATFAASGSYHVTLTVTDNDGASSAVADSTVTVSDVNAPPSAAFSPSCLSLDCTFTDQSTDDGTITAWAWDFGDGGTATTQNPTHSYSVTVPDTFTVRLIVTDNDGAADTTTSDVTVAAPASCSGGACDLTLQSNAKVKVTLTSVGCTASGNKLGIKVNNSAIAVDTTLFTDGCNTPEGTSFFLESSTTVFSAGAVIVPTVTSGSNDLAFPPTLRLQAGSGSPTWILEFDDGEGCGAADPTCGGTEPDFDDLVITIEAVP